MIFVFPGAVFDGRQPIRGGVPVVFPQFGRPNQSLFAMHGFARTSMWALDAIVDAAEDTREPYPQPRPRLVPASLPAPRVTQAWGSP